MIMFSSNTIILLSNTAFSDERVSNRRTPTEIFSVGSANVVTCGMARPSSRGGPPGGGGIGAPPPGTGYRGVMPQSRGGPRPGSGLRTSGGRPGTGAASHFQPHLYV
eukprot:3086892-Pyramimonas_sp.AAC.1